MKPCRIYKNESILMVVAIFIEIDCEFRPIFMIFHVVFTKTKMFYYWKGCALEGELNTNKFYHFLLHLFPTTFTDILTQTNSGSFLIYFLNYISFGEES